MAKVGRPFGGKTYDRVKVAPKEPIWSFYHDGVTQSLINKYLTCKYQCRLEYYEGWTSKKIQPWFIFGNAVHYVLQHYYLANRDSPPIEQVDKWLKEYKDILGKEIGGFENLPLEKFEEVELIFLTVRKVLPFYFIHYRNEFNKHFFVKTERVFKVPIDLFNGRNTFINGKFDGIYNDEKDNLLIMDHKCLFYRFDELSFGETVKFDIQANLYLLAAYHMFNKVPKGIVFNVIRKHGLKQKQEEPLKDFANRVMFDIMQRPEHYFMRIPYYVVEQELFHWADTELRQLLFDIEIWYKSGCKSYINPGALKTIYGNCSMYDLIVHQNNTGYYIREKPFKELEE